MNTLKDYNIHEGTTAHVLMESRYGFHLTVTLETPVFGLTVTSLSYLLLVGNPYLVFHFSIDVALETESPLSYSPQAVCPRVPVH